jgi:hypothetical protein
VTGAATEGYPAGAVRIGRADGTLKLLFYMAFYE